MLYKRIFIFLILLVLGFKIKAQKTYIFSNNLDYRTALDLFDHHSYSNANALFKKVFIGNHNSENSGMKLENEDLMKVNARFYSAICDLKLNQVNADKAILEIAKEYPYSPLALTTNFYLGTYYFNNHDFTRAYLELEKTNSSSLTDDEFDELNFDLGYCYLSFNRNEDADLRFNKVINHKGPFFEDAMYYSGHLAFLRRDFESAKSKFSALNPKGPYADIYPIYLNQIYLAEGNYDQVIKSSQAMLNNGSSHHNGDWNRLLGSAYFFKKDFAQASVYFDRYKLDSASRNEANQVRFQIGFTDYKLGKYPIAIRELQPLYNQNDPYAQHGLYILGLCYLKTNSKAEARNAFQLATTLPGDPSITENALVYYAKLSYEFGFNQESIQAAKILTANYPKSPALSEMKTLEGEILLNSKNYPEAYRTLKSISNRNAGAESAFQKVAYYYGLEEYNQDHFPEAILYLKESTEHPVNKGISSQAQFWQAESFYELKDNDQAINHYQQYLSNSDPQNGINYKDALYGDAYAYFKKENYSKALSLFEKFNSLPNKDVNQIADVKARLADCYFMLKQYGKAKNLYTQDAGGTSGSSDYALFQSANIQGLQNNQSGKIKTLQSLLSIYPKSTYADQAQFGLGASNLSLGNSDQAIAEFRKLVSNYPQSPLVPKAQLNIGLIFFNNNQDDEALNQYKKVVSLYPGSPESRSALSSIKNIYVQKGDAAGFLNYAGTLGNGTVSNNAQDSITFQSSNQEFIQGNFQGAIQSLGFYCQKFPQGAFIQDAHENRAKSLEKLGRADEAESDYLFLANLSPKGKYSEDAQLKLGAYYLRKQDYSHAIPVFQNLASSAQQVQNYGFGVEGLMNSYSGLNLPDSTLFYANKLKSFTKSSPAQLEEMGLQGGKAYLAKGDTSNAETFLQPLTHNARSVMGAEARYLTADIQFRKGNYKGSQKILFDLIKQLPAYNYWVGKSFVLLADNYIQLGDLFQAKSTLQSVIDHYDKEDDVKKSAREKLSKLPQGQ